MLAIVILVFMQFLCKWIPMSSIYMRMKAFRRIEPHGKNIHAWRKPTLATSIVQVYNKTWNDKQGWHY